MINFHDGTARVAAALFTCPADSLPHWIMTGATLANNEDIGMFGPKRCTCIEHWGTAAPACASCLVQEIRRRAVRIFLSRPSENVYPLSRASG
ncbi:hypothetical protein FJTKL_04913 [Diaporthe vaccinii]|uniref:Uncharacterized protein n=1 Tax=Diaporthe vaccinii TaxID=105482 RepID=A0ABR4DRU5_9PEZI